jgi:recombination protein RecR
MKPIAFEYLIDTLKSLPGIGNKQAERIAYFLIKKDSYYINKLISSINDAHEKIKFCKQCNNFSVNELCDICSNPSRNNNQLCIVSTIEDLMKIETTNTYTGLYYVLNGEIDVKTKTNIEQEVIKRLMNLIKNHNFKDVIIATN